MPERTNPLLTAADATIQTLAVTVGGALFGFGSSMFPFSATRLLRDRDEAQGPGVGFSKTAPVPLVARAGTNYLVQNDLYGNRPRIEIISFAPGRTKFGTDNNSLKAIYDAMILTNVQEQDAEKIDVIETFGEPHLFASGRFMRRYTFQGVLRTAPVNYQATNVEYKAPQTVQLRVFYDKFMRASVQAVNRSFTRIIVDREIFEGFVTTMNIARDANNEPFAPFVFTMCAFNRQHIDLDPQVERLIGSSVQRQANKTPTTPPTRTASQRAAQRTELAHSETAGTIAADPKHYNIGRISSVFQESVGAAAKKFIQLLFANATEMLFVESDTPGIEPIYKDSVVGGRRGNARPLHGSVPPPNGVVEVDYRITDYWKLYNTILSRHEQQDLPFLSVASPALVNGLGDDNVPPLAGSAAITVTTAGGAKSSFIFQFALEAPQNVRVERVEAVIQGVSIADPEVIPIGAPLLSLGEVRNTAAYDVQNAVNAAIVYYLGAPDGTPVPAVALNGAKIEYTVKGIYPAIGDGLFRVTRGGDQSICNAARFEVTGSPVPDVNDRTLTHGFRIRPTSPTPLATTNPFDEADRVVIELQPTLKLRGYPKIQDLPRLSISIYHGPSKMKAALASLHFLEAEWNPKRNVKTDRYGYLKFVIKTAGGIDASPLVKEAVKAGALVFTTRFASSETNASVKIKPVPLGGKAFGTGEAIDPDTRNRIALQLRLDSLYFDAQLEGLVVRIEIASATQLGAASSLFSTRFWPYVSEVLTARVEIPTSYGIASPTFWSRG